MNAEKLAGLLAELTGRKDVYALVMLRGRERPWTLADKHSWLVSVRVQDDGLVRVASECQHGSPDFAVFDAADVDMVGWMEQEPGDAEAADHPDPGNFL
jgi:hypothetical protein